MSRLEELINELCPDGVEYRKIGELTNYEQPSRYIVSDTDYDDSYEVPVLTAGQTFILGYTNEKDGIYDASLETPVIIFDDFTAAFKWVDFNFKVKSSAMKLITAKEDLILIRYLFHIMGVINYSSDEHKRLWISKYSEIEIPVPPLEIQKEIVKIQKEIVKILDKLTKCVTELQAELQARKQQFEYYKEYLLPFKSENVTWIPLGELSSISRGASPRPIKNFITEDMDGVNWIKIGDVAPDAKYITSCAERITAEGAKKSRYVYPGDFILSNSMSFGRPYILQIEGCIHDGWLAISGFEEYVTADYLYYVLTSSFIQKVMCQKASFGGAVQNLNADIVRGIEIPVPSKEEQRDIVAVLDRFSMLCTDISTGLPAEIEARQKQYEYYRDKLLTFKELPKEA